MFLVKTLIKSILVNILLFHGDMHILVCLYFKKIDIKKVEHRFSNQIFIIHDRGKNALTNFSLKTLISCWASAVFCLSSVKCLSYPWVGAVMSRLISSDTAGSLP